MSRLPLFLSAFACAALAAGCERVENSPPPSEPATEPVSEVLPAVDPPLDRSGLLLAVARTASDFTAGRDDSNRQRTLDGRRFEVGLRFGCPGVTDETRTWTFDAESGVLRVRVEPELTIDAAEISDLDLDEFEAIEGFWIQRPWLLETACPRAASSPEPAEEDAAATDTDSEMPEIDAPPRPAMPRVGIAHFYTANDSRTLRRDSRAYQATRKLAAGEQPSANGYDLVLSGRLSRMPDGRAITCAGTDPQLPPACVVSVTFDRVELRRPDGELVAEWSSG